MLCYLFNMNKRPNSTKQPNLTEGHQVNCELKEECDFTVPVFKFNPEIVSGTFSPTIYNYIYIPYWSRYYRISEWSYTLGLWEASCTVDVLASFKQAIGDTTAYIIRCASRSNGDIVDAFYPATTKKTITKLAVNSEIYHTSIPSGCYVVGIINKTNSLIKVGAVSYYAIDQETFSNLLGWLYSSAIYSNETITEISSGLFKSMFNPFQYFVSCTWFPYPKTAFGNPATDMSAITVGYWATNFQGLLVRNVTWNTHFHSEHAIPLHPQSSRGAYVNKEPFTRLTLFYPPFGEIPIDTTYCQYGTNNYLAGSMYIDSVNGMATCYITITNGYDSSQTADYEKYMTMVSAQVGVPIQLAQVMPDWVGKVQGAGGMVANLLKLDIAGAFQNLISGNEAQQPKVSTSGSNGSFNEIAEPPFLIIEHSEIVADNNTEFGRPLCQNVLIRTLSGYIQCGEDDHPFGGMEFESKEINRYLKEGFFYE